MPPTIQSGKRLDADRRPRSSGPPKSDLVCRPKYTNNLPDIPFDPKFITYPFEANRFVQYNATSLERTFKHELLAEHDLGVTIDLINPDTYSIDPNVTLDPADERLLEEDISTPGDSKRSKQHSKMVSWLRKTEYISSEYNRSQHRSDKVETKVAYSLKKQFTEEDIYKDRESQLQAIEKTFNDAKIPINKHYSKPHVSPVEVMPIYPDFKLWANPCAQVIFDFDPAPKGKTVAVQVEEMSQAMIRGMVDESGDQFVGYFLPSEETLRKRKRDTEEGVEYSPDDEYEYKMAREYNWNVKNKTSRGYEENYFFVFRKGEGVFYNELETRVRLSKRRAKETVSSGSSVLVVKHREQSEQELVAQSARLTQLDNQVQEEEEEEEEEEEMVEATAEDEEMEDAEKEEGEGEGSDDENQNEGNERVSGGSDEEKEESGEEDAQNAEESDKEESENEEKEASEHEEEAGEEDEEDERERREEKDEEEIFGSASDKSDNEAVSSEESD
ncbi:RNA polymerase II-associated factor 1 homolog [Anneissia japonica]|uniref:RNA polymerase II-associated factor 1 homolog n=1 Tax=Anneissia japonica TaxID=1529436 RepID=UPI001425B10C|nr:RNA polymerase II-associated factor 1 homolog [Anneissia japonica]